MFRRFYMPLILICLYILIASSGISAASRVEVLFYTGKVVVTSKNNRTKTYTMPQPLTELPLDTTVECVDGVAILNVGEVQVSMGRKDKLKLFPKGKGKMEIVCLSGDVKALFAEKFFKIDKGKKMEISNKGMPVAVNDVNEETEEQEEVPIREILVEQITQTPTITLDDEPEEDIYTSPHY